MNLPRLLRYAMDHHPSELDLYPITPNIHEMRRQNGKHEASITVDIPDETVLNLRGDEKRRDLLIFLRIPRKIVDLAESGLVLPGIDKLPKRLK